PYVVGAAPSLALAVTNPVRDPSRAEIAFDVARAGRFEIAVFDLEGQRVASWSADLEPRLALSSPTLEKIALTQLAPASHVLDLRSGTYVVRVRRHGVGGDDAVETAPLVVTR